jgi:hypothetical protein
MSAACVSDALVRLDGMALAGSLPDDVAHEAEAIAAGWWWNAHGDLIPDRLVLLVQELQRWCVVAAGHYALRWEHLNRAGRPREAEDAARWAVALDQAQQVLRVYA